MTRTGVDDEHRKKRNREYQAKWFERNRETQRQRVRANNDVARERNIGIIIEYLSSHPCVDCGESDIVVLEFDHVRGEKCASVTTAVKNAWSEEKLRLEIDKCEIRCCNCHRRKTAKDFNWYKANAPVSPHSYKV